LLSLLPKVTLYDLGMNKETLGWRIAKARKSRQPKATQQQLADHLGVTPQAVSGWERNDSIPEVEKISKIADFLEVPISYLLERDGKAPKATPVGDVQAVPLLDKVAAGKLKSQNSQIPVDDVPLLAFADLGRGDWFALTVEGDSMDRWSPDGSTIVINQADRTLISGKAYVINRKGETTFKVWRPDPPRFAPFSTNPVHEPIFVKSKTEAEKLVVGRVKRTVLDL
jgi:SOS-response transcriptional repressor LexA